ncbi:hypothetical protein PybrP1_009555 [[Pythium] brassicae (nom. inval.)]|nr:hypothetical protein PybrP1_009555 [[Pythium] brassicae (nom. inval.)]
MQMIYRQLGGEASVYTLDQRGTGRSSQILCDPSAPLDAAGVRRCAQALSVVLGSNIVAFSLTSAAYDLVSLIQLLHAKTEVYVYGLGYGTLVVERLLHFGLADIKGYILDGSATTSGAKKSSFAYISKADEEFGQVGDAFLALCERDSTCSTKFPDRSVVKVLHQLLVNLDDAVNTTSDANCASIFTLQTGGSSDSASTAATEPASYKLRRSLAAMMQNVSERAFVPVLIYRLNRCSERDKPVLKSLLSGLQRRETQLSAREEVVHDIIAFSELWESPSAMETKLSSRFTETSISSGRIVDQLTRYCLFTGDTSEACTELGGSAASGLSNVTRLAYPRDAYWNAAATIPATSSVLLLSGSLDGQSPAKHAQDLEDALKGSAKEQLKFGTATHNVLATSRLRDGTSCGLAILESYIASSGDLNKYDTSCIDKLPSLSFALTRASTFAMLGTADAYDGELVASPSLTNPSSFASAGGSSSSSDAGDTPGADSEPTALKKENESLRTVVRRYRVAFIVAASLLLVMFVAFGLILLRWWRERQYRREQGTLEALRLEQEPEFTETEQAEHKRNQEGRSTIYFRSMSSEEEDEDWNAGTASEPPPLSANSLLDWNFRSNPRRPAGDDEMYLGDIPIQPPPFSDWRYSSANHLRIAAAPSRLLRLSVAVVLSLVPLNALELQPWGPCTSARSAMASAECTTAVVPLCYDAVCTDESRSTITLALTRLPATNADSTAPRILWVLPDRSDAVLPAEANDMLERLYQRLGGAVSVHTLDQRGVGQSTPLTCSTDASSTTQLESCLRGLHAQLRGNVAAFSITSAAFDLVTIISQTQPNADVVVYGLGFGSLVVERLLHFGVAAVKGYVLEGSATTSGAAPSAFPFASTSDAEFGRVSDAFLALCDTNPLCSAKFQAAAGDSVTDALRRVLARTTNATSSCASLSVDSETGDAEAASTRVRRALAMLMQNATERALIPAVVYRLHRCSAADQQALKRLARHLQTRAQELASHRELAFELQTFSELWEPDAPAQSVLETHISGSLISPARALQQLPRYCVFAGDTTSSACAALNDTPSNRSATTVRFTYARDQYWNVGATIPAHASVLFLSGGLDGTSPPRRAQLLADAMVGAAKKVMAFPAGTQGSVLRSLAATSSSNDSDTNASACALDVLSSYILNRGALDALDTSCLASAPATPDFRIAEAASLQVWGVADPYADGDATATTTAPGSPGPTSDASFDERAGLERSLKLYRVAFFVALAVLVVVVLVAGVTLWVWWKRKQLRDEENQLRRMRGEEPDDLELLRQICLSSPDVRDSGAAAGARRRELDETKAEGSESARSDAAEKSFSLMWDHADERPSASSAWAFRSSHLQL